jgi:high-affinity nickel permease
VLEEGASLGLALVAAGVLGLRHAVDPDHVAAVVTLAATDARPRADAAGRLGLSWGLGHGLTLLAFGIPFIALGAQLPKQVTVAAEGAVGVLIVLLALRLLSRWRSGYFHVHVHEHEGGLRHAHLHSHEREAGHAHAHRSRTSCEAFGLGLVHGLGGSAGVSLLVLASVDSPVVAVAALAVLALGTAVAMGILSTGFGLALGRRPLAPRLNAAVPILGLPSLLFGAWYSLGALLALPYPL